MSQVLSNYSIFNFFLYYEKDNGVLLVSRAAWLPCVRLISHKAGSHLSNLTKTKKINTRYRFL